MSERGRIKYLPKIVITEMEDIKREDELSMDCEAFRKMVQYARVGREARRLTTFGYNWKKKAALPPVFPKKSILKGLL